MDRGRRLQLRRMRCTARAASLPDTVLRDLNEPDEIVTGLFCGAHPKSAKHIEALHEQLGITDIVSLAEDIDRMRLGIESDELAHCAQRLRIASHFCPVWLQISSTQL